MAGERALLWADELGNLGRTLAPHSVANVCVCVYECMYANVCVCMYYMYVCVHVCMCTCVYTYVY